MTGSSHTRHFNLPFPSPQIFLDKYCSRLVFRWSAPVVSLQRNCSRERPSSDIRSRDALIVLKVDSFIYCPTNHGKWLLSLSIYLSLSLSQIARGSSCRGFRPPFRFSPRLIADAKEQKAPTRGRDTREFYSLSRATFLCIQRGSKTSFIRSEKGEEKRFPPSFRRFRPLVRIVRLQRACDASPLSTRPCN